MNEPRLRFKDDNGNKLPDWKENKIGELGTFTKGAPLSKADISDCGEPLILYGELYTTYNEVAYNIQRRTQATIDEKYYSHVGDVIIPTSGETAEEISTATCVMVPNVALGGDLNIYRSKHVDGRIISYVLNHQAKWKIAKLAQGKSVVHIQAAQLANITVKYPPSHVEQQKIASLFTELDTLIQSAEKELEGYRELKQGMLQKMFPKKGEKVPEIRFPEFTGDWKQRKVSEMFKITRGYVLPVTETSEETNSEMPYPVYSSQTKNNGLMGYYSNYLYEDAITWTTDGANAGTVNYRAGKFYCTNVCGVLLSDKIEASKAIAEALNNVAKKHVSYVGNPKLMNNVMAEIQIAVPPTKEEQDKISSYFELLDNLITLQQRELDGYKELKKGLLQQMFC